MSNKITQKVINHIKESEGLRLKAYSDPGSKDGLPVTIGYGTTLIDGKPFKLGTTITKEQAEEYLRADLIIFGTKVAALVKVPLNDNQFGALVSFAYNIGLDAFAKSTLLRHLNAGDYSSVPAQMRRWNKNDGKVMKGLVNRREKEVALWSGVPLESTEKPVQGDKDITGGEGSSNWLKVLIDLLIGFLFKRK
jgi:lysozyme